MISAQADENQLPEKIGRLLDDGEIADRIFGMPAKELIGILEKDNETFVAVAEFLKLISTYETVSFNNERVKHLVMMNVELLGNKTFETLKAFVEAN